MEKRQFNSEKNLTRKTSFSRLGATSSLNVVLLEASNQLSEVVILGYAPVSREKVLGAISSVKQDQIEKATPVGAFDAVQGRLAGVQILSNGGPGAGFDIRVRGTSTFSGGGTSPLYVVDGQQLDDIDNLDPNDIQSMEVLKDGATAKTEQYRQLDYARA